MDCADPAEELVADMGDACREPGGVKITRLEAASWLLANFRSGNKAECQKLEGQHRERLVLQLLVVFLEAFSTGDSQKQRLERMI